MFLTIKRWIFKHLIKRAKLYKWFELEDIRAKIFEQAEKGTNVSELICSYLSIAICSGDWNKLSWLEIQKDFFFSTNLHSLKKRYKIFNVNKKESEFKINDSSWFIWANLFAKHYGWSLDEIKNLDIDDALCLIQEVLFDEQIEREWQWGLSEKSVSYDKRSNKSKFVPLKRPEWMQEIKKNEPIKNIKIPKSMLPVGVIYGKAEDFKH